MTVCVVESYNMYGEHEIDSIFDNYNKAFARAKEILKEQGFEGEELEERIVDLEEFCYCNEVSIMVYLVK